MTAPSSPPAVGRIALPALVLGALALALVGPSQAGSQAAPEITDPAGDIELLDTVPVSTQPPQGTTSVGTSVDIEFGWVEEPTADTLQFTVDVVGTGGASSSSEQEWRFHFTLGATNYVASARIGIANVAGTTTPGGVASAVTNSGGLIVMTVPKSAVGNPAAGAVMTGLFIEAESFLAGEVESWITDRAPNSGNGQDYVVGGGSATPPGDDDNDQLNDTCEIEFYGDVNGTNNASADDDGDGLTNGQECAGNPRTDPTNSDTDGDGVNDKDDPFPADPTKGGASGTSTSTNTGTGSGTGSGTSSTTGTGTASGSDTGSGTSEEAAGEVRNLDDAVERLQSDLDYLGTSAGGMVAVLILAILALAVRWSL